MVKRIVIDDAFIAHWERKYDEIERDQGEYEKIVELVAKEIADSGTLSQGTFERLRDWKSKRLKAGVKAENFPLYAEAIRRAVQAPEEKKLGIVDDAWWVAVPFASTILHFIYPGSFPIMDVRTVETLNYAGYIHSEQRSPKRYPEFRKTILDIQRANPRWSLRQIDRALFAYHKLELAPRLKGECCDP